MVIDAHGHLMFTEWAGLRPLPVEEVMAGFTRLGVGKACLSAIDPLVHNVMDVHRQCNDKMSQYQKAFPDRLIGFATVNPQAGKAAVEELRRAVEELGLYGLKLHPWLQGFSVMDRGVDPVMEEAQRLGIPVLFHDGTPPYCTPLQIASLAPKFPKLPIILGHLGLKDLWLNAVQAAQKYPNVYLCTCGATYFATTEAIKRVGVHRIMFGSDGFFGNEAVVLYSLRKIERLNISKEKKRKILHQNAAELLGI